MSFTVRQARDYKGLTQVEVAQAVGVSESTYRKYEKFPRSMPVRILDRFSKAMNIPIADICLDSGLVDPEIWKE